MKSTIRNKLSTIANYLELTVAIIIAVMIAISIFNMIVHIYQNPLEIQDSEQFYTFMNDALSLIVGIEFLKMIIIPTSNNMIETLLFAVSRHIIIDHGLGVMIIGTICIFILFVIKRYLFKKPNQVKAIKNDALIRDINKTNNTFIPMRVPDEKIEDFILRELKQKGLEIEKGVCIEIEGLKIRIDTVDTSGNIIGISILKN